jgi:glycosyltransferase involved in cell wall biosynthesis
MDFYICVWNILECIGSFVDSEYWLFPIWNNTYDDGSSDNSSRICNDFVKEYGNIHLITQKNKGLSAAAK